MTPCVGCGYCCITVMCSVGQAVHGDYEERCPYLLWSDTRYECRLAEEYSGFLSIGAGCCSSLNTWRQDVKERKLHDET